ncbi:MAG: ATP-binding protein [Candidatus Desulforudis sp.]|nr:ATP-binding protein [Desulforudis sp.]
MSFIEREKVLRVLMGFNPWWVTGKVSREHMKPIKRLAFQEVKQIMHHRSLRRVALLSGARRVGKTTIIYQLVEDLLAGGTPPSSILFVSFDHPVLKFCSIGELLEIFQQSIGLERETLYLFFDEAQYAADWDKWVKTLYDQNPRFRIVVTGSASPVLAAKSTESGVGRWTTIRIPTLSFFEYAELKQLKNKPELTGPIQPIALHQSSERDFAALMRKLYGLEKHFTRYLLMGGFPEIALSDDLTFAQQVMREDIVDKVLKRDMTALFGVRNVAELEKVFLYLCFHSGGIIVQDTIAKEIGVSRSTAANYLELLVQANLVYVSNPAEIGGKKVLKARPKVYLADAAIRNAVLLLGQEVLADPVEMGLLVETAVFKHVHAYFYPQRPTVGYYRHPRTQKDVDIVVSFPVGRILIEVKYREDTATGSGEAIVDLARDKDTSGAIVVTKRSTDFGVLEHATNVPVVKIPAFAFLYLLGYAEREAILGK